MRFVICLKNFFQFQVVAQDSVPLPLKRSVTATVTIEVVFDSPPVFNEKEFFATISELEQPGYIVYDNIEATDPDSFAVRIFSVSIIAFFLFEKKMEGHSNHHFLILALLRQMIDSPYCILTSRVDHVG